LFFRQHLPLPQTNNKRKVSIDSPKQEQQEQQQKQQKQHRFKQNEKSKSSSPTSYSSYRSNRIHSRLSGLLQRRAQVAQAELDDFRRHVHEQELQSHTQILNHPYISIPSSSSLPSSSSSFAQLNMEVERLKEKKKDLETRLRNFPQD